MREYPNARQVDWLDPAGMSGVRDGIFEQRAVILVMPQAVELRVDAEACRGRLDEHDHVQYNCDPALALWELSEKTLIPGLQALVEDAVTAGSLVDVDIARRRIIFHN